MAEGTGEFLAFLENVDGQEEGVEVCRAVMHGVECTLTVFRDLLLHVAAGLSQHLSIRKVAGLKHVQGLTIELEYGFACSDEALVVCIRHRREAVSDMLAQWLVDTLEAVEHLLT